MPGFLIGLRPEKVSLVTRYRYHGKFVSEKQAQSLSRKEKTAVFVRSESRRNGLRVTRQGYRTEKQLKGSLYRESRKLAPIRPAYPLPPPAPEFAASVYIAPADYPKEIDPTIQGFDDTGDFRDSRYEAWIDFTDTFEDAPITADIDEEDYEDI